MAALCGFIAMFQLDPNLGRMLAVHGGAFVAASLAWGIVADPCSPRRRHFLWRHAWWGYSRAEGTFVRYTPLMLGNAMANDAMANDEVEPIEVVFGRLAPVDVGALSAPDCERWLADAARVVGWLTVLRIDVEQALAHLAWAGPMPAEGTDDSEGNNNNEEPAATGQWRWRWRFATGAGAGAEAEAGQAFTAIVAGGGAGREDQPGPDVVAVVSGTARTRRAHRRARAHLGRDSQP